MRRRSEAYRTLAKREVGAILSRRHIHKYVEDLLQLQDHLMYRRWGGPKEPLQIPLRRCPSEHYCVVVNEGQVLALLRC